MKGPSAQTFVRVLSESTPVIVKGKTIYCKATLVTARGGRLVHYTDLDGELILTERYSRTCFGKKEREDRKS